jgi:hypothetical protein
MFSFQALDGGNLNLSTNEKTNSTFLILVFLETLDNLRIQSASVLFGFDCGNSGTMKFPESGKMRKTRGGFVMFLQHRDQFFCSMQERKRHTQNTDQSPVIISLNAEMSGDNMFAIFGIDQRFRLLTALRIRRRTCPLPG